MTPEETAALVAVSTKQDHSKHEPAHAPAPGCHACYSYFLADRGYRAPGDPRIHPTIEEAYWENKKGIAYARHANEKLAESGRKVVRELNALKASLGLSPSPGPLKLRRTNELRKVLWTKEFGERAHALKGDARHAVYDGAWLAAENTFRFIAEKAPPHVMVYLMRFASKPAAPKK